MVLKHLLLATVLANLVSNTCTQRCPKGQYYNTLSDLCDTCPTECLTAPPVSGFCSRAIQQECTERSSRETSRTTTTATTSSPKSTIFIGHSDRSTTGAASAQLTTDVKVGIGIAVLIAIAVCAIIAWRVVQRKRKLPTKNDAEVNNHGPENEEEGDAKSKDRHIALDTCTLLQPTEGVAPPNQDEKGLQVNNGSQETNTAVKSTKSIELPGLPGVELGQQGQESDHL